LATQINSATNYDVNQMDQGRPARIRRTEAELKLITSGTTVSYTLPPGSKLRQAYGWNDTADAVLAAGGYVTSTGVWTSAAITLNDVVRVIFEYQ